MSLAGGRRQARAGASHAARLAWPARSTPKDRHQRRSGGSGPSRGASGRCFRVHRDGDPRRAGAGRPGSAAARLGRGPPPRAEVGAEVGAKFGGGSEAREALRRLAVSLPAKCTALHFHSVSSSRHSEASRAPCLQHSGEALRRPGPGPNSDARAPPPPGPRPACRRLCRVPGGPGPGLAGPSRPGPGLATRRAQPVPPPSAAALAPQAVLAAVAARPGAIPAGRALYHQPALPAVRRCSSLLRLRDSGHTAPPPRGVAHVPARIKPLLCPRFVLGLSK